MKSNLKFFIVVEKQDYESYAKKYGQERILVLPFANLGIGVHPARNWIKEHSKSKGEEKHWQVDDDMIYVASYSKGKETRQDPDYVIKTIEGFTDRYKNVAITGLTSNAFVFSKKKPFGLNQMVYGFFLFNNEVPYSWRCKGEDTDMSIQCLENNWCTINMHAFCFSTKPIGKSKGGNEEIYQNNGRLERALELKDLWPYLPIKITERFGRVHQDLSTVWRRYKQPLIKK